MNAKRGRRQKDRLAAPRAHSVPVPMFAAMVVLLMGASLTACGEKPLDLPKTAAECDARLKALESRPTDDPERRAVAKHCLYLAPTPTASPNKEWTIK
jgi:entry exclusion lipoprotein TrbK